MDGPQIFQRWIVGPKSKHPPVESSPTPPRKAEKLPVFCCSSFFSFLLLSQNCLFFGLSQTLSNWNLVNVKSTIAAMEGRGKLDKSGSSSPVSLQQFISIMTPLIDMEKASNSYLYLYSLCLSNYIFPCIHFSYNVEKRIFFFFFLVILLNMLSPI